MYSRGDESSLTINDGAGWLASESRHLVAVYAARQITVICQAVLPTNASVSIHLVRGHRQSRVVFTPSTPAKTAPLHAHAPATCKLDAQSTNTHFLC